MTPEMDFLSPQIERVSMDVEKILVRMDNQTGMVLSENQIKKIFYGEKNFTGIKEIFWRNFNNGGYLSGELEDAYALMMELLTRDTTPECVRMEIENFQNMVTK